MTELERVTKLAGERGARLVMQQKYDNPYDSEPSAEWLDRVSFTPEELLAFEQAVLAKQSVEIERLRATPVITVANDLLVEQRKMIESLQQKLQAESQGQEPIGSYWGKEKEYGYHLINLEDDIPEGTKLYASPVIQEEYERGVADERERAAKVCELTYQTFEGEVCPCFETAEECASAIRKGE